MTAINYFSIVHHENSHGLVFEGNYLNFLHNENSQMAGWLKATIPAPFRTKTIRLLVG